MYYQVRIKDNVIQSSKFHANKAVGDVVIYKTNDGIEKQGRITSAYRDGSMVSFKYMVDEKYGHYKSTELTLLI